MPDDRKPKKHIEGDVERAARRRVELAAANVPVEIDPEETPPPREPPDITAVPGFSQLSGPLREVLTHIHNTQREHDIAFTRLWDSRNVGDEIEALTATTQTAVAKLEQVGHITALLHKYDVQLELLIEWRKQAEKRETRQLQVLEALDKRLDAVERDYNKLDNSILLLAKQITDGLAHANRSNAELQRELDETKKDQSSRIAALDARITSLEHTRTSANAKISIVATIAAMLVTVGVWLLNKLTK